MEYPSKVRNSQFSKLQNNPLLLFHLVTHLFFTTQMQFNHLIFIGSQQQMEVHCRIKAHHRLLVQESITTNLPWSKEL